MRTLGQHLIGLALTISVLLAVFIIPFVPEPSALAKTPADLATVRALGSDQCLAPPPNFDPLAASDYDIALYNLPNKPFDKNELPQWEHIVKRSLHRVCPTHYLKGEHKSGSLYSITWSGYRASPPSGYNYITGARGFYLIIL